ncbi:MAG: SDR family NAD(P)-dependent oxidoreductase, partial [bacterium]|nr:SDR family NAD(P)-dependent oxidoreductase [bacterium]
GTPLGDPIEINALGAIYGQGHTPEHPLFVGSVKANIGHLEGAAGIAGAIKVILALNHEAIPPQAHFQTPNPHIPWDTLPITISTALTPWKRQQRPRLAAINSFGFSGTNAHVILEEAPIKDRQPSAVGSRQQKGDTATHHDCPLPILTLSAKTPEALQELALKYIDYLNTTAENLADICYTANVGRNHFEHRMAVFGSSKAGIVEKLSHQRESGGADRRHSKSERRTSNVNIAFLFTGQGSQYAGMGRELYETHPVFREALKRGDALFRPYLGISIIEVMYAHADAAHLLNQTLHTQPAIFSVEYALLELWRSWGIEPAAVMGHSIGEYVAAYAAGVFSLEDAVKLVAARARLMQSLPEGGLMAAVFADETMVLQAIDGHAGQMAIAAVNGPASVVLSGDKDVVETTLLQLNADDIASRRLHVSHAFHSPCMDPILNAFRETASEISYSPPTLPLISNISGTWTTAGTLLDAEYWTRHIREAVRFYDGMQTLDRAGYGLFLEIGADAVLTSLGRRCLSESRTGAVWLTSLRKHKSDWEHLAQSLSECYRHAVEIDWTGFDAPYHRRKVPLPTYPFQCQHYDILTPGKPQAPGVRPPDSLQDDHPFLGQRIESPLFAETVIFQSVFHAERPEFLQDHMIYGEMISPAAAHISMILSAVKALFHTCCCSIEEVDFLQPLIVGREQERTVQLIIEQITRERMPFRIVSRRDAREPWTTHCSGSIRLEKETQPVRQPQWQPDNILSRCRKSLSGAEFNQKFREAGYHLGTPFQCIEQIRYEDREALTTLKVAPGFAMYEIHPGLLDSVWQTISVASIDILDRAISNNQILIPLTLAQFRCHSLNFTGTLQAHSHGRPQEGFSDGDTTIRNEHGELLIEVKHLIVKETGKDALLRGLTRHALTPSEYGVEWQPQDLRNAEMPENAEGTLLIFSDRKGCGEAVERTCQHKQIPWIRITPGSGFTQPEANSFSVNPTSPEDFARLFGTLQDQKFTQPFRMLFLWPLNTEFHADMTSVQLEQGLKNCCEGLLNLIKTLAHLQWEPSPRLWLITQHAQYLSGDHGVNVPQSALVGLARTIALEHPELWGSHIDLDAELTEGGIEMLLTEIERGAIRETEDYQVAFRADNRRYVARLKRLQALQRHQREVLFHPNATYWITGGLGALGLLMAREMIRKGARHLVLSGRNAPGPAAEKALKDFHAQGAQVAVKQVDVADADALADVVDVISGQMPPLKGIVHAAGMLDVDLLTSQTWERFRQVLSGKALGAWNLHRLTHTMSIDFLLLFSSVVSMFGDRGQGNYAAANAVLDALAHYRKLRGLPATSINWGPWAAGMAASDASVEAEIRKRGLEMLQPAEGMALLEHLMAERPVQVGIMTCDLERFVAFLRIRRPGFFANMLSAGHKIHKHKHTAPTAAILPEIARAAPEQRTPLLVEYLCRAVGHVIGCDPVPEWDINAPLYSLGLDSLMAVELRNLVKQDLNVKVPVVTFMENTGLSDLARVLAEQLPHSESSESVMTAPESIIEGEL